MTRSRRKTPIFGITTAESEKAFKQQEHQRERSSVRDVIKDPDAVLPTGKEFGNPWAGLKDGRRFWKNAKDKDMRK